MWWRCTSRLVRVAEEVEQAFGGDTYRQGAAGHLALERAQLLLHVGVLLEPVHELVGDEPPQPLPLLLLPAPPQLARLLVTAHTTRATLISTPPPSRCVCVAATHASPTRTIMVFRYSSKVAMTSSTPFPVAAEQAIT